MSLCPLFRPLASERTCAGHVLRNGPVGFRALQLLFSGAPALGRGVDPLVHSTWAGQLEFP